LISEQLSQQSQADREEPWEAQALLEAILNATTDAIISTDADGLISAFNAGAERIFGHRREHMLGQPLDRLMPERYRANHTVYLQQFAASDVLRRKMSLGPVKGLRADGQEIDLDATLSKVRIQNQWMLISYLADVTERLQAQAQFKRVQTQLSELTQKLLMQEKTLVKRLSQELHDQLGQTLAAIRMAHETVLNLQGDQAPVGVARLQAQLGQQISLAVRQVRQVLVGLRPPLLDEQGLAEALDNELRNRAMSRPNLDLTLYVQPELAHIRYPAEVEYAAFMVLREALDNALKHAEASAISVRLSGSPALLHLVLTDNGTGVPSEPVPQTGQLGILGMHERASVVGAIVNLEPVSPSGTRVAFVWTPPVKGAPS
jgi:PAS domain S-box-containing protein